MNEIKVEITLDELLEVVDKPLRAWLLAWQNDNGNPLEWQGNIKTCSIEAVDPINLSIILKTDKAKDDKNIFFQDQAEWYIVCNSCYEVNKEYQWSGSTPVYDYESYWKDIIYPAIESAEKCEWCKKKFGEEPNENSGKFQFTRT